MRLPKWMRFYIVKWKAMEKRELKLDSYPSKQIGTERHVEKKNDDINLKRR